MSSMEHYVNLHVLINMLLAICDVTWEIRTSPSLGCLHKPVDNLFKLFNAAGLLASLVKDLGFVFNIYSLLLKGGVKLHKWQ